MLNWYRKDWTSLLYLMTRRPSLKSLVGVILLFLSPLLGVLVISTLLDYVLVRFLWYSGLWKTHFPCTERCYLNQQYYFPYLVLFPTNPCCTTYMKWGGYYTFSGPWPSPALLWTHFPPHTHSYWSPYSPWRVGMMKWSRVWTFASKFLDRFPHKWRSH